MKTCGQVGGRSQDGSPCGRPAKKGKLCHLHSREAEDEKAKQKREFLVAYERDLLIDKAARSVGLSGVTVWRYRQEDPDFDVAVAELKDEADNERYRQVQDSLFEACLGGDHKGGERMFWLVNVSRRRGDGLWKNIRQVEETQFPVDLEKCTEEELELLAQGHSVPEVFARTRGLHAAEAGLARDAT